MKYLALAAMLLTTPALAQTPAPPPSADMQAMSRTIIDQIDQMIRLRIVIVEGERRIADLQKQVDEMKAAAAKENPDLKK